MARKNEGATVSVVLMHDLEYEGIAPKVET